VATGIVYLIAIASLYWALHKAGQVLVHINRNDTSPTAAAVLGVAVLIWTAFVLGVLQIFGLEWQDVFPGDGSEP